MLYLDVRPTDMAIDADGSFALKDVSEIERRRAMMALPHMSPLVSYVERIRSRRSHECDVPLFDPCDGGVNAKILFLLEAPGPKAVGSSFISRNNPDLTARNMNRLLGEAALPREASILWNIIPWYIGSGKRIRAAIKSDVQEALPYLMDLISLLTNLKAIVLVGKPAASAAIQIASLSPVPVFYAPHPSPKVFNIYPHKRIEALELFKSLLRYV
jgi:uracil-DNA glycosylase